MKIGQYAGISGWAKIGIWLGIMLAAVLLLTILSGVIMACCGPINMTTDWIRGAMVYQDVFILIVPVLLTVSLCRTQPKEWLHLTKPKTSYLIYAILLMLVALPFNNLLAHWNEQMVLPESWAGIEEWMKQKENASEQLIEQLMDETQLGCLVLNVLVVAVLAGLSEEICFRGMIQGSLGHNHWGIWLTAILFSAIHLQFYGFVPRMLLGALFGYMMVWSGSIWIPITMHITNNACVTILYYIAHLRGMDTTKMDAFGTGDTLWVGIVCGIIVVVGIYFLRRSMTINSASSRTSAGN